MTKMGETQRCCLRLLADTGGGVWYAGCGWLWNTHSGTTRIMESFVRRGLAEVHLGNRTQEYKITDAGRAMARKISYETERDGRLKNGKTVMRWVATYVNADGMRTLMRPAQGRNTCETPSEAESFIEAVKNNNSADVVRSLYGDNPRFAARQCECWAGHFDPVGVWFDD